ncbi:MAG TPA: hypothetical protein VHX43_18490 [Xanthobacteraceae bacterium]|jgi:hypothetical protein|nr:hypothetical protein [Xanthobacteraceae bacterium]
MRLCIAFFMLLAATPVYAQATMGSTSGASASVNVSDPPAGDPTTHLITTPTIAAPGLAAAGIETCLGSASGGLSLMGGGFTFGATKVDEGCTIRLLSRQLYAFGLHKAALALMCQDEHVAAAMEVTGTPCPSFPVDGGEHVADAGASAPASDEAGASAHDPLSLTAPAHIAHTGYILDLKRADGSAPLHLAFAPQPLSPRQERAWFDRASDIN